MLVLIVVGFVFDTITGCFVVRGFVGKFVCFGWVGVGFVVDGSVTF